MKILRLIVKIIAFIFGIPLFILMLYFTRSEVDPDHKDKPIKRF